MVVVGFGSAFFFLQEQKSNYGISLAHNPSERNLKDEDRDKFDRHFFMKCRGTLLSAVVCFQILFAKV